MPKWLAFERFRRQSQLDGLDWRRLFAEDGVGRASRWKKEPAESESLLTPCRHPTPIASLNDAVRPSAGSHIAHNLGIAFLKTSLAEPSPRLCPNSEHFVVCEAKSRWDCCSQIAVGHQSSVVKPMVLCH